LPGWTMGRGRGYAEGKLRWDRMADYDAERGGGIGRVGAHFALLIVVGICLLSYQSLFFRL
jgi:hypothetical protein